MAGATASTQMSGERMFGAAAHSSVRGEVHDICITAAHQYAKPLARLQLILACKHCGERGRASGFRHDARRLPKRLLGGADLLIANEDGLGDELLGEGKHERADLARG